MPSLRGGFLELTLDFHKHNFHLFGGFHFRPPMYWGCMVWIETCRKKLWKSSMSSHTSPYFRSPWCQGLSGSWNTKKTKIRTRTTKQVAFARAPLQLEHTMLAGWCCLAKFNALGVGAALISAGIITNSPILAFRINGSIIYQSG